MIITTFIVWITTQMRVTELVELHLYIDTKPVIYGQDLSFICYSDGPAKTSLSSWYWFKNDRILFQDGSPRNDVDSFKYNENRVTENIRNLTISDFEFSDIQNYKCRHAFKEAILDLDTKASKFVYLGNRTIMVTTLQDTQITFDLFNVAPIPTCAVVVKNIYLSLTQQSINKDVYLYNISFQRMVQCGNGDIITNVECDVGGLRYNTVLNISCGLSDPNDRNGRTHPYLLIVVVSISAICIIVIIIISVVLYRKRELMTSNAIDSGVEDEPLNTQS